MKLDAHLTRDNATAVEQELTSAIQRAAGELRVDASGLTRIDSAGVAVLAAAARLAQARGGSLRLDGLTEHVRRTLQLFPAVDSTPAPPPLKPKLTERLGAWSANAYDIGLEFLVLCADVAWFTLASLFQRRGVRVNTVLYEMAYMGSRALGVVALISFMVGGTMALQSAAQLRQFGANIFVADLIGISITRELGPLMTAIVVAGRSGSAVAAELATMTITEEIDALRTMGIHPVRFLVVPKVLAISITQPLLTMLANAAAIFGGFVVAITYLDVGPTPFLSRLQEAMYLKDLLTGLFKSVLFANLIVTVGAVCGFRTRGGADAVGRSTTTSVVASIFAVIVADAACSLVFYF